MLDIGGTGIVAGTAMLHIINFKTFIITFYIIFMTFKDTLTFDTVLCCILTMTYMAAGPAIQWVRLYIVTKAVFAFI